MTDETIHGYRVSTDYLELISIDPDELEANPLSVIHDLRHAGDVGLEVRRTYMGGHPVVLLCEDRDGAAPPLNLPVLLAVETFTGPLFGTVYVFGRYATDERLFECLPDTAADRLELAYTEARLPGSLATLRERARRCGLAAFDILDALEGLGVRR